MPRVPIIGPFPPPKYSTVLQVTGLFSSRNRSPHTSIIHVFTPPPFRRSCLCRHELCHHLRANLGLVTDRNVCVGSGGISDLVAQFHTPVGVVPVVVCDAWLWPQLSACTLTNLVRATLKLRSTDWWPPSCYDRKSLTTPALICESITSVAPITRAPPFRLSIALLMAQLPSWNCCLKWFVYFNVLYFNNILFFLPCWLSKHLDVRMETSVSAASSSSSSAVLGRWWCLCCLAPLKAACREGEISCRIQISMATSKQAMDTGRELLHMQEQSYHRFMNQENLKNCPHMCELMSLLSSMWLGNVFWNWLQVNKRGQCSSLWTNYTNNSPPLLVLCMEWNNNNNCIVMQQQW